MTFICASRGWPCCTWATTTSNVSIRKIHPLVAYNIIQHDDVVFINNATFCLSLCIYHKHLSWTNSPLFTVLKAVCGGGCPRTGVSPTVSSGTAQPLSLFMWIVDSNHISHSHSSSSAGTIDLKDFTPAECPFGGTYKSEPWTGESASTWGNRTGEPVSSVV